jgi:hypothetical protein
MTFSFALHFCAHSKSKIIEQVEKFEGREEKWSHACVTGILQWGGVGGGGGGELHLEHEKFT